nr:alpha/beta hydrolase [Sodalis praecaptivus]
MIPAQVLAQTRLYTLTAPDGVNIAVQEAGNPAGPPIVFIHGLLGSHLNWDAQINSPLLQRYRLITYDLRGHGQSGKPTEAAAYTDGKRWADELATVLTLTRGQQTTVVGWSLGGTVISNYLAYYGDSRLAGALYVDGVIELTPSQIPPHPRVYRDMTSPDLRTHLDAERDFLRLCFYHQPDAVTFERLLANAAMAAWDMQKVIQSMEVAAAQGLSRARIPVLLLYGDKDALVNPTAAIARATALNPRIRSKIVMNAGHAPFMEEAQQFNHDLAAFIAEARR